MIYFIYKTTHQNGKYYVGRHSTENINDGYVGSGKWPRSIKDKTTLTREILEYAESEEQLIELEGKYLKDHFGKPNCMNATQDPIGASSEKNPMFDLRTVEKFKGNNHWTRKNPEKILRGDTHWMNSNPKAKEHFLKTHPALDGRNSRLASARGKNIFQTNNPSKWRSEQNIHHWQNGNSPNSGGKLNKKLIAEGRHNLVGPEHNRRMIAEGKNPWVGPEGNLSRLAAGTHPSQQKKICPHCGKETSVGMFIRWHGENCKHKDK